MPSIPVASDKLLWFALGTFAVFAVVKTHSQLITFRKRCAVKPSETARDAGVDQTTEDAIKLDTLEALARGVNFDLRNVALKIIMERATTDKSLEYLIQQVESSHQPTRLRALKSVKFLSTSPCLHRICNQRIFNALVKVLRMTAANANPPNPYPPEISGENDALQIISRLMPYANGRTYAFEAGFLQWLKECRLPGCTDVSRPGVSYDSSDDSGLWDIIRSFHDTTVGRELLSGAGLLPQRRETEEEIVEVIEMELEEIVADALAEVAAEAAAEENRQGEERRLRETIQEQQAGDPLDLLLQGSETRW
ncbi:hypothetical protein RUND412_004969 [Rhizina undulata]